MGQVLTLYGGNRKYELEHFKEHTVCCHTQRRGLCYSGTQFIYVEEQTEATCFSTSPVTYSYQHSNEIYYDINHPITP
jgi:hypothetical protein